MQEVLIAQTYLYMIFLKLLKNIGHQIVVIQGQGSIKNTI